MMSRFDAALKLAGYTRNLCSVFILSYSSAGLTDEVQPIFDPAANMPDVELSQPDDVNKRQAASVDILDQQNYRVGLINVNKLKRIITIPGQMLTYEDNKAIEFLATMKDGFKSYESVFSLDTNAFEFNLACILIGLDAKKSVVPKFHFDPLAVEGDMVSIMVSWEENGKIVEYDAIDLLKISDDKPVKPSIWSYTGSLFMPDNRYLAQVDGVLIGMIHDPASIIEHKTGLGIGNWGAITIDRDVAPQAGQSITLKIRYID
ncbi:MAG: hypothetical protein GY744_00460 [Gammaproteobacteria bacterium]|nr:hypothetical protein [Gammaproteobacteria bacterium]